MATFRVEKNKDYTVMSNYHLRDTALSLKAKGLLSQMLSLPENWDYTLSGLAQINKESKDAIRSAVNELEEAGYIQRRQTMDEGGKFSGNEYIIREYPETAAPLLDFPTTEKPSTESTLTENPTELNIDISSKDISEKENKKEKAAGSTKDGGKSGRSKPLSDSQLQTMCVEFVRGFPEGCWDRDTKNALYLALLGFYAPRENKKQSPARTTAGFTALTNRLTRLSETDPVVMIDMLERATAAGWKSVYLQGNGQASKNRGKPPSEGSDVVCL